jgi:chorismate mutase
MSDATSLVDLRARVEQIDRAIIALIDERVRLARVIGRAKRAEGLPILDPSREAAVIRRAVEIARDYQLEEEDVREIYWHLIGLSRRAQLAGHAETAQP